MLVGFFRTKQEVQEFMNATEEDKPQVELLPSPSESLHPSKFLRQESDVSERSFRPHDSLTKIAIQEKLVSSY